MYESAGAWGGGKSAKAPNPQTPGYRETSSSNHQSADSDAWVRLRTVKYAWERLAVGVFLRDGRVAVVAGGCAERSKILQKLCDFVRISALKSGYERLSAGLGKIGAWAHFGGKEKRAKGAGIIFTTGADASHSPVLRSGNVSRWLRLARVGSGGSHWLAFFLAGGSWGSASSRQRLRVGSLMLGYARVCSHICRAAAAPGSNRKSAGGLAHSKTWRNVQHSSKGWAPFFFCESGGCLLE
jgi:hypothetical protein